MASSPDLFEAYFRRADADGDGRISGQEAVSFFQGANLSRDVLARIWQYADKGQTGSLSREEFYNALKLVTVAQTGRELTPVLVAKALNGPAALQIPAPQIQYPAGPMNVVRPNVPLAQPSPIQPSVASSPFPKTPTGAATASHMPMFPPTLPPTPVLSSTFTATPINGAIATSSTDWPTTKSSSWSGPASSATNLIGQPSSLFGKVSSNLQDTLPVSSSYQVEAAHSATSPKNAQLDLFGGDVFTAVPAKASSIPSSPRASEPVSMGNQTFNAKGVQTTVRPDPSSTTFPVAAPIARTRSLQSVPIHTGQQEQGFGSGTDETRTWPKLTDLIIRRYAKILSEVDTDKDGKISGIQARDLFLSWRLPREVLKQIWDLSDQDRDSMLSLREFCMALYLMERHREGRALPLSINPVLFFDESGIKALRVSEAQIAAAQKSTSYNASSWQQNPSVLQSTGSALPLRPVIHGQPFQQPRSLVQQEQASVRPPVPTPARDAYGHGSQKSRAPVLEMHNVNQLSADDQLTLQTKHQEAVDAEKKVQELENSIMDSKEKLEFYRSKMQEIVLFKTRCDNRLAEITERASADKREVESLVQRYEEKFKQAGESQSRLLADEAAFRDIQERRSELYNAIIRMEQSGDTNALLQARADRLHNDLDELTKALNAKCKQFGLKIKPTRLLELPYGWQPGMQENAAQWDEDWDKFEDEGFTYVQEFTEEGTAGSDAAKPKAPAAWDEEDAQHSDERHSSTVDTEVQKEESTPNKKQAPDQDNLSTNGDASPKEEFPSHPGHSESGIFTTETELERNEEASESDAFTVNGGDWASAFSHHRSDDTDSNDSWSRTDVSSTTEVSEKSAFAFDKNSADATFGYTDPFDRLSSSGQRNKLQEDFPSFGPIRTKETSVFFDNSVPSTPLNNSSFNRFPSAQGFFDDSLPSTPLHNNIASQGQGLNHDKFLRFDSFSSTTTMDSFSRFDSFNNAAAGQSRGFTAFDETPRHSTDSWNAF